VVLDAERRQLGRVAWGPTLIGANPPTKALYLEGAPGSSNSLQLLVTTRIRQRKWKTVNLSNDAVQHPVATITQQIRYLQPAISLNKALGPVCTEKPSSGNAVLISELDIITVVLMVALSVVLVEDISNSPYPATLDQPTPSTGGRERVYSQIK
jgi:hypothetical protein